MPYSNLTELNVYEFGNKTDVDAFTTEIDNRFKSSATVTEHTATSTSAEAGTPVVYAVSMPAAAGTVDLTMPAAFRVSSVICNKTGANAGAACTLTLGSTGNAITNAVDMNVSLNVVVSNGTLTVHSGLPAGGLLRFTTAGGSADCRMLVTVSGYHI
jgi:hypothetical protein